MDEVEITLRMPRALWEAASRLATRRGVAMEQMMRQTLSAELLRTKGTLGVTPLAQLRGQLVEDFDKAQSWGELQGRLMIKGYALHQGKDGLDLIVHPSGRQLCTTARLGFDMATLTKRFGPSFLARRHRPSDPPPPLPTCPDRRADLLAKWQAQTATQPTAQSEQDRRRLARHV